MHPLALALDSLASSISHLFSPSSSSSYRFTLVDPPTSPAYPLFGLFPLPLTLKAQALVVLALVALSYLVLFLVPQATAHDALRSFLLEFLDAAKHEIMPIVSAPISVGLDLSARVGKLGSIVRSSDRDAGRLRETDSGASTPRRSKRSASPFNSAGMSGAASSSRQTATGSNYPGLRNTGNTCFFNSVLQSLASLGAFQAHLLRVMDEAEKWDVPTPVTDATAQLLLDLNTPLRRQRALMPSQLVDALSSVSISNGLRTLVGAHQQQDSHELLVLLLDAIDEEVQRVLSERKLQLHRCRSGLRSVTAPSLRNGGLEEGEGTLERALESPFRGLIAQRTACGRCGYVEAVRHYAAEEISLNAAGRGVFSRGETIEDCLDGWTQIEQVEWICHRCSLRATLERARRDVEKLESAGSSMTASKKKRLREARRIEAWLSAAVRDGVHEEELRTFSAIAAAQEDAATANHGKASSGNQQPQPSASLPPSMLASIKLERVLSPLSTKQIMLARPPPLLIIHLNRSSYSASRFGASKSDAHVDFGEVLEVERFTTDGMLEMRGDRRLSRGIGGGWREEEDWEKVQRGMAKAQNGNGKSNGKVVNGNGHSTNGHSHHAAAHAEALRPSTTYRLSSIVVHYGGHSFGHYVSFRSLGGSRRRGASSLSSDVSDDSEDDEDDDMPLPLRGARRQRQRQRVWARISDESVQRCSIRDVLGQNPVLLFYERMEGEAVCREETRGAVGPLDVLGLSTANGNGNGKGNGIGNGQAHQASPTQVLSPMEAGQASLRMRYRPKVIQRWSVGATASPSPPAPSPPHALERVGIGSEERGVKEEGE